MQVVAPPRAMFRKHSQQWNDDGRQKGIHPSATAAEQFAPAAIQADQSIHLPLCRARSSSNGRRRAAPLPTPSISIRRSLRTDLWNE